MYSLYSNHQRVDDMKHTKYMSHNQQSSTLRAREDKHLQLAVDGLLNGGCEKNPPRRQSRERPASTFSPQDDDKMLQHTVDDILNGGCDKKKPTKRSSLTQQPSFQPHEHENLHNAVDDLLKEHQNKIPRRPWGVTHRDSFSTISTAAGFPDPKLCHVTLDRHKQGFVPLEISFPTPVNDENPHVSMPLLQKTKCQVPDVFDFEEQEEDIVFVLADEEVVSCTSSMEVVRKISSRLTSSVDNKKMERSTRNGRSGLHRAPSRGMDVAGPPPPLRQGMNELSFFMTRVEI
jgi:hypothetical protein